MAVGKLKRHESTGIDQMLAELIKAGGRTILPQIHKLINCIQNKEELPEMWKDSIILPIYKKVSTNCSNYTGITFLPTAYKILSNILLSKLITLGDVISGIIGVDFDAICQLLIIYFAFIKYLRRNWNTMKPTLREGPRLRITLVNFELDAQNSLFIYI
jgi:hypothetical protein